MALSAGSIGILSTYPPTQCGLATFTASLREGLLDDRPDLPVGIVRAGAEHQSTGGPEVIHEVGTDARAAATALNGFDVAIIQHEYGIYGGPDGDQVLDILDGIRVPVIAVVHTVLAHPTPRQRFILDALIRSSAAVVTMSETGRRRLLDGYGIDPCRVTLIPHGAKPFAGHVTRTAVPGRRPMILTWGLLGPGKGIEWGIAALEWMRGLAPRPRYVIAGQTHPKVVARDGERYRESLVTQAEELGVSELVEFVPGYLNPERLRALVQEADVVLLPYDSHDQVTSGVLTEAIASTTPVVSTAFAHAVELLTGDGGGLLVPHEDAPAMAAALTRVIVEPGLAESMAAHSAGLTPLLSWSMVASQYRELSDSVRRSPVASR